jgi:hypothetical protein
MGVCHNLTERSFDELSLIKKSDDDILDENISGCKFDEIKNGIYTLKDLDRDEAYLKKYGTLNEVPMDQREFYFYRWDIGAISISTGYPFHLYCTCEYHILRENRNMEDNSYYIKQNNTYSDLPPGRLRRLVYSEEIRKQNNNEKYTRCDVCNDVLNWRYDSLHGIV